MSSTNIPTAGLLWGHIDLLVPDTILAVKKPNITVGTVRHQGFYGEDEKQNLDTISHTYQSKTKVVSIPDL